ncbi:unnamed protein product [Oncorhynchus mykiss]|uniref:WWE domain-containing protein n=1 Tax=Oncorhynchus mykiss TaxID=8022 RepID=A0A060WXS7_ONCMY|nr:unnamed protein product [Oncorhynchus mykiss]
MLGCHLTNKNYLALLSIIISSCRLYPQLWWLERTCQYLSGHIRYITQKQLFGTWEFNCKSNVSVHYVIMHSLLSTTSQFDGNTSLVGKCADSLDGNLAMRNEICLFFVKEDCKQGEKCSRVHFKMPYKWEVNSGQTWSALPENETIERDFCDPSKIHSEGAERVRFDSMSRGLWDVRRLSTVSSVTKPTYVLTTEWVWFWEDEYGKWIQYASIKEMHRLSSITSEDLEKRFQEDQSAVVKFTAGQQSYELSFRDMTQFNERFGTIRMVRRRPVFVSTVDAQAARSRRNGARNPSQNFRAVPGSWDKSAIPDIGYKTVTLLSSDRDYQKVQRLFNNTMRGFQITSIERVQNRDLWEVFQWYVYINSHTQS